MRKCPGGGGPAVLGALLAATLPPAPAFAQSAPAPSSTPAPSSVPPAVPPAPPAHADWVDVGLVTDEPGVGLYAKESRRVTLGHDVADSWSFACAAPCRIPVDPSLTYRVMGDDLVPSVEFHLAPGSPPVTLRVTPAHRGSPTFGVVTALTAGASGFAGILLLLLDVAEHEAADAVGSQPAGAQAKLQGRANTYGDLGAGFLGAGAALGVAAFFLLQTGTTELAPVTAGSSGGDADARPSPMRGVRWIPGGVAF